MRGIAGRSTALYRAAGSRRCAQKGGHKGLRLRCGKLPEVLHEPYPKVVSVHANFMSPDKVLPTALVGSSIEHLLPSLGEVSIVVLAREGTPSGLEVLLSHLPPGEKGDELVRIDRARSVLIVSLPTSNWLGC